MKGSDQGSARVISVSAVVLRRAIGTGFGDGSDDVLADDSVGGSADGSTGDSVRDDCPVLTVRKTGTSRFMLPGGKWEPGETPRECAIREVSEELGIKLADEELRALGRFETATANEPDYQLVSEVFEARLPLDAPQPRAQAEIAELRWVRPSALAGMDESHCAPWAPLLVRVLRGL